MMLSKEKVLLINDLKKLPPAEPKRGKWLYCEDTTADCVDGYRCAAQTAEVITEENIMDDTISRQAAIDELRKCRFVVDGIEKIKGLPPVEPHWIPCSERLPKDEGFYLVTLGYKHGAETNIRFFKIENEEGYWSKWGNENITAWMPMPAPWKGE
jgi:hypothetical protein